MKQGAQSGSGIQSSEYGSKGLSLEGGIEE